MRLFKKEVVTLLASMAFLCTTSVSADASEATIKFFPDIQAKENSKEKINYVTVSFPGTIYKDKPTFDQKKLNGSKLEAEEAFMIRFIDANARGEPEQVLDMWNPPERADIKERIAKGDIFKRNQALHTSIAESRFVARMNYGPFILLYVEHYRPPSDYRVKLYPILNKDGQYFATNLLTHDFFYNRIAADLEQYFDRSQTKK